MRQQQLAFISSTPTTFLSWQLREKAALRDAPPMLTRRSYET